MTLATHHGGGEVTMFSAVSWDPDVTKV